MVDHKRLVGKTTCNALGNALMSKLCSDANGNDMKECDAPVSNKTLAGMELTGRLPMITSEEILYLSSVYRVDLSMLGIMLDHCIAGISHRRRRRKAPLVEAFVCIVPFLLTLVASNL